ncbi:MAG: outer membrane beta-barrel protein, partial [Ferruginibacter sp.]
APGVSITNDENINMAGKTGVNVLIDGRPTQLSAKDLANYLKSTPGSAVDKIEIIMNPSAKYDAQGNAGIINIRLKKNTAKGTNGSLSTAYSQSIHSNINFSGNINHRKGKWNWFANASTRKWRQNTHGAINRFVTSNGAEKTFENTTVDQDSSTNADYKAGADLYLNKKNTFGFLIKGNEHSSRLYTPGITLIKTNSITDSSLNTLNDNKESTHQFSINLNYKYEDTLGNEWNIDADYARFKKNTSGYVTTDLLNAQLVKYGYTANDQTVFTGINIYSIKTDVAKQIKKWNTKLEAGFKWNTVQTANDLDAFTWNVNQFKADTGRTNRFDYTETQYAAYASLTKKIKKWEFQIGFRAEQTIIKGKSIDLRNTTLSYPDTAYLNIFPTAFVRYSMNEKNSFGFSYSRRINRPDYHDLNPFEYIYDNYSKERCNPYLLPEFSNSVELSYSYRGALNLGLGYSVTNNSIQQVSTLYGEITSATQYNVGQENRLYLNISLGMPVTKWWDSYINLSPHYKQFSGSIPQGSLDNEAWGMGWYASQSFALPKKWKIQLSSWGSIATRNAMTKTAWLGSVDAGVSKSILKDKLGIRLSATDIFNTQRWKQTVDFGNVHYDYLRKWESRAIRLQLTCKFGKTSYKARERESGAQEQFDRVK